MTYPLDNYSLGKMREGKEEENNILHFSLEPETLEGGSPACWPLQYHVSSINKCKIVKIVQCVNS